MSKSKGNKNKKRVAKVERYARRMSQFTPEEQHLLISAASLVRLEAYQDCGRDIETLPDFSKYVSRIKNGDIEKLTEIRQAILDRYYKYVYDNRQFPRSKAEVCAGNVIDVSNWFSYEESQLLVENNEFIKFCNEFTIGRSLDEIFCFYVPPFASGAYKLQDFAYVWYNVENVDFENHEITIYTEFYVQPTEDHDYWVNKCRYTTTYTISKETDSAEAVVVSTQISPENIKLPYELEDYDNLELQFSKFEFALLHMFAVDKLTDMERIVNTSLLNVSASKFLSLLAAVNMALYKYSPKVEHRNRKGALESTTTNLDNMLKPTRNTRRVRIIDTMRITSVKVPHAINTTTLRNYKLASWQVRGGVRRMKSGKLVPFKPSVHHRKALAEKQSIVKPSTSRII